MATTLDSGAACRFWPPDGRVRSRSTSGSKNKTNTICFNLGLIFRWTA